MQYPHMGPSEYRGTEILQSPRQIAHQATHHKTQQVPFRLYLILIYPIQRSLPIQNGVRISNHILSPIHLSLLVPDPQHPVN